MSTTHRSIFLKEIKTHYPELTIELNNQEGIFCDEVDVFLTYVQKGIDREDHENTKILLERVDRYYKNGNKALKELIRNGVCETLKFENSKGIQRAWALQYLSLPPKKGKRFMDRPDRSMVKNLN